MLHCFILMTVLWRWQDGGSGCQWGVFDTRSWQPAPASGTMDQDKQSATKHSNLIHFKTIHLSLLRSILLSLTVNYSVLSSGEHKLVHIMLTVMRQWQWGVTLISFCGPWPQPDVPTLLVTMTGDKHTGWHNWHPPATNAVWHWTSLP